MIKNRAFKNIANLWSFINNSRRLQFIFVFFLMTVAALAEVVSIGAVLPFLGILTAPEAIFDNANFQSLIDFLGVNEPNQLILPITLLFIIAAFFSGLMRVILLWAQTRWSHAIGADISFMVYSKTLHQPYLTHLQRNSSELIAGITTKVNNVAYQVIQPLIVVLSSFLILIAVLTVLISINPLIAITTFFGFGLIYLLIIFISTKRLNIDSKRISKEQSQVVKSLQEGLGGIRDVIINNSQDLYAKIYRNSDIPLRRAIANVHILSGAPRYAIEALGMIFIAIIAYLMVTNNESTSQVVPFLGALAIGAQRLLPVLQMGYQSWITFIGHMEPLQDVLDLLNQEMENLETIEAKKEKIEFKSSIKLEKIKFKYNSGSEMVLRNIDLEVKKGSMVGIIGTTGSGKTTLIDVIMGLLQPTKGKIYVDNIPVNKKNIADWQMKIAHVPQHIYLSDSSVKENIAFGEKKEEIDMDKVYSCAEAAELTDVIKNLERGFDTDVGERGARLSGGQRQRLGIARALYKEADILVLDEATSALDILTEGLIMKAIENLNSNITCFLIAHRLETLKNCTQIITLEHGEIISTGVYEEIIKNDT